MMSSVRRSARWASAVSRERLSKYSTATLLEAGAAVRAARRHGGGEPSGYWAWRPLYDATTLSCTTRVSARSALGPPSTVLDRPRPFVIAAATPRPAAGSGGSTGPCRIRETAAHPTAAATVADLPTSRGLAPFRRQRGVLPQATRLGGRPALPPRSRSAPGRGELGRRACPRYALPPTRARTR